MQSIHGVEVNGVDVDSETRCAHYHGATDVIALKFKCCGKWFPCHQCHAQLAGHAIETWSRAEFETPAILCGACGHQLTIREYLDCASTCPACGRSFNPACAKHAHYYFSVA